MNFLFILLSAAAIASPLPTLNKRATAPSCPDLCAGTNFTAALLGTYICGDRRLGPTNLPSTQLPLLYLLDTYSRFGNLCPGDFLKKHYSDSINSWIYPSSDGYLLDTRDFPIKGNVTLKAGQLIDRFGGERGGKYVSPQGAPYAQRAIPPSNLNVGYDGYPANYHVYRVLKNFDAMGGPIAPGFEQPGQGVQYVLYDDIVTLLVQGYLETVKLDSI